MREKVVVFGGAGFLGSHVVDQLALAGFDTHIADIKSSAFNSHHLNEHVGNIQDKAFVLEVIRGAKFIFNFAGLADLEKALDKPIEAFNSNVIGHLNILEAALESGSVSRVFYASTIYVQGHHGGFYRCSKIAAEAFIEEFQKSFGLPYTIIRYGSLYGPRSQPQNGVRKLVEMAINQRKIVYSGSVDAEREYIHVEDAARLTVSLLSTKFQDRTIMLTGTERLKVIDLMQLIAEITDVAPKDIRCLNETNVGHYVKTSNSYRPQIAKKLVPVEHYEIGQGITHLIEHLQDS